ncbi:hypothetical protein [Rhodococcus baikonurensis]|uniref:DUF4440 domain-containing protein n=1 Tax=Rhodococcus baikonurensis TaxID=172041 RepID=A0ABV5XJS4_9NOCA
MTTPDELRPILDELMEFEPLFHRTRVALSRDEFDAVVDPGFREIGPTLSRIAPDSYLVTYRLAQAHRVTERSSIWRFTENRWSVLFHQGTVVESGLEA